MQFETGTPVPFGSLSSSLSRKLISKQLTSQISATKESRQNVEKKSAQQNPNKPIFFIANTMKTLSPSQPFKSSSFSSGLASPSSLDEHFSHFKRLPSCPTHFPHVLATRKHQSHLTQQRLLHHQQSSVARDVSSAAPISFTTYTRISPIPIKSCGTLPTMSKISCSGICNNSSIVSSRSMSPAGIPGSPDNPPGAFSPTAGFLRSSRLPARKESVSLRRTVLQRQHQHLHPFVHLDQEKKIIGEKHTEKSMSPLSGQLTNSVPTTRTASSFSPQSSIRRVLARDSSPLSSQSSQFDSDVSSDSLFSVESPINGDKMERKRRGRYDGLKCAGLYGKVPPLDRIRVWHNEKGEQLYDCICGQRAPNLCVQKLKRHAYRHSVQEYTCDMCGKTFRQHWSLNAHKRIHKSVPSQ